MSYKKVRFIGYAINTAPPGAMLKYQPGIGPLLESGPFPGLEDDIKDIQARCRILKAALDLARNQVDEQYPDEQDTLTIFVVPEFFFHGDNCAYPMGLEKRGFEKLQSSLKFMVRAKKWTNWLILPGTALGSITDHGRVAIYNTALLQAGGADLAETRTFTSLLHTSTNFRKRSMNQEGELKINELQLNPSDLFKFREVVIGVDTSSDFHLPARRASRLPLIPGSAGVQIKILPSCGHSPDGCSDLVNGGWLFHCDGLAPASCALYQIFPEGENLPNPRKPEAQLSVEADACLVARLFGQNDAGQVLLYKPVTLPRAAMVPGSIERFQYQTENGAYGFDFELIYDGNGLFKNARASLLDRSGRTLGSAFLPHSFHLEHSVFPLTARMEIRHAPLINDGEDMLLFVDLECGAGSVKGALHAFRSRKSVAA